MRNIYINILFILCLAFFIGCAKNDDNLILPDDEMKDEILLSSVAEQSAPFTRAVGNFPGDGSVGLFATREYNEEDPTSTDWRAYDDILNAKAIVTSVNNGAYSFAWQDKKYWPFDGASLYFMAYSPIATGSDSNYLLSETNNSLFASLQGNMRDIMYATNNLSPQAYNKNSPRVDLGEFRHLLSQLTIQVIADENMPSSIRATSLSVSSRARSGSVSLMTDTAFTVSTVETPLTIPLLSGNVDFSQQTISVSQLLFPASQDVTQVSISLTDIATQSTFSRSYMMSYFASDTDQPIRLQAGKNTILRIYVNGIGVNDPTENIQLEGLISDWDYQGRYGINIQ